MESKEESTTTEADAVAEPGVDDEEEGDASDGDGDGEDEDESEDDAGETLGWVKSRRLDESGKAQASARAAADPQKQGSDQPKGSAAATKTVKDASRSFDELLADELSELRDKKKVGFLVFPLSSNFQDHSPSRYVLRHAPQPAQENPQSQQLYLLNRW